MDKISGLPDDLLVKILSFVPTKVAVSTCVLSKRWEFLWMWLPRLEFITEYVNYIYLKPGLGDFINKKLPLHKVRVIESLLLQLCHESYIKPEDIKRWIDIAVSRYLRELKINYYPPFENLLPSSLFICKSLVILKLKYWFLVDVSSMVSLPSLKTLHLELVKFVDGKSLQHLLCGCPVLEDLSWNVVDDDNLREFTITVPSLQSLSLSLHMIWYLDGYEIDTTSLKYLKLEDWSYCEHYLIKNMPKLREASVDGENSNLNSVIGSITSVKHLTIWFYEDVYGDGFVFNQLEHLKLFVWNKDSWKFLDKLLKVSPNLRVLDISVVGLSDKHNGTVCWNQPTSVPECLLSSLQIFKVVRILWETTRERYCGLYLENDPKKING